MAASRRSRPNDRNIRCTDVDQGTYLEMVHYTDAYPQIRGGDGMDTKSFRAPVRLRVDGMLVEVESLREAAAFLDDWPQGRRGPVYACAKKGCEAALTGTIKVEDARKAFESFARITGILARRQYVTDPITATRPAVMPALNR